MTRLQIDMRGRVLGAWFAQRSALGARVGRGGLAQRPRLRLRPEQARALADELNAVLDRG